MTLNFVMNDEQNLILYYEESAIFIERGMNMRKKTNAVTGIVIVSLIMTVLLGVGLIFTPLGLPTINAGTNGFGAFDMRFSYTADNVMTVISHYNGDINEEWGMYYVLDFIFAIASGTFMFVMPLYFYMIRDKWYLIYRTAFFSAAAFTFFNVVENILILRLMNITPLFTEGEADIASGITSLKWVFAGIWAAAMIVIFIIAMVGNGSRSRRSRGAR